MYHREFLVLAHCGSHHSFRCSSFYAQDVPSFLTSLNGLFVLVNTMHLHTELSVEVEINK